MDAWWALRVTPKCFSNSRLVKLSNSRASIKQVWKMSAYWIRDKLLLMTSFISLTQGN
jgi:hypothetical protein